MPRRSQAEMTVKKPGLQTQRITPPPGLSDDLRAVFIEIAAAAPAEHFQRGDIPLVLEYSRAILLARQAGESLARDGAVVDGRPSPWLTVQEKAQRMLVSLSLRLRLCPQGRMSAAKAGSTSSKSPRPTGVDFSILRGDVHE